MKEIQEKLKELNEKLGRVNNSIDNLKEHMEFLKKQKQDYTTWELQLNEFKQAKKDLEAKIEILNKAESIILEIN